VAVLSVDLAYKKYRDIGAVILEQEGPVIRCDLLTIPLSGLPSSSDLAEWLNAICVAREIRILLLDGPQGWKSRSNGLKHSRQCERALNTPAKTGEPMSVKPSGYGPFVNFSISTFDALCLLGWERLAVCGTELRPTTRVLVESFPLSAWRSLNIEHLPAKRRARAADLESRLALLAEAFPISLSGPPTHDQLQALVAGLAGLAIEQGRWDYCSIAGVPPAFDSHSREGFIVNPLRPCTAIDAAPGTRQDRPEARSTPVGLPIPRARMSR
jgi:hypothetical protein